MGKTETRPAELAAAVRRCRALAEITQEELAERAGVSIRLISDLERGAGHLPRKSTVGLILDALSLHGEERDTLEVMLRPPAGTTSSPSGAINPNVQFQHPRTQFVGRAKELEQIRVLLEEQRRRLVVLTGPGGVGKTRLALKAAETSAPRLKKTITMVPLETISDHQLVAYSIAAACGFAANSGFTDDHLVSGLARQSRLLILDNFEQVRKAAPLVLRLFDQCPDVSILVTSQEILHLSAEQIYEVQPLALPQASEKGNAVDQILSSDAAQLLCERLCSVRPDLQFGEADAAVVRQIVTRLDGLPLAIELAAARVRRYPSLKALYEALSQGLPFLTGGPGDAAERHRQMSETIAWSTNLLSVEERTLLCELSVFLGGWTLDAAISVCRGIDDTGVDGMDSLVNKNLIRAASTDQGQPRFVMLGMIREHAIQFLDATGSIRPEPQRRHFGYYLALADAASQHLEGGTQQEEWLGTLEIEHDNIREALTYGFEQDEVHDVAEFALAMSRFWRMRGHVSFGRNVFDRLLESEELLPTLRCRLLYRAGSLATAQSDYRVAVPLLKEAFETARSCQDDRTQADAANMLGVAALARADFEAGITYLTESLELCRSQGDTWGAASALQNLGNAAIGQGRTEDAAALFSDSLSGWKACGDESGIGYTLASLTRLEIDRQAYTEAIALGQEGIRIFERLGDEFGLAFVMGLLGLAETMVGAFETARPFIADSVATLLNMGNTEQLIPCLQTLAILYSQQGNDQRATILFSVASAATKEGSVAPDPVDQARLEEFISRTRHRADAWSAWWTLGETMSLTSAAERALLWLSEPPDAAGAQLA